MRDTGRAHKALRSRQRLLHDDGAGQVDDSDDEECVSPRKMMRHNSGDVTAQKAAEYGSRNVGRHRPADELPGEFFIDVGHDDDDHAGHEDSLHESPEDELMQVLRGGRQQGRRRQCVQRRDDHLLAAHGFRQQPDERRGQRHCQDSRAHRQRNRNRRCVEDLLQIGEQRLRVIDVKECAHARQHAGDDGGARWSDFYAGY